MPDLKKKSDTYIVSYPKCGRTWLRLMLGRIISRHFNCGTEQDALILRDLSKYDDKIPNIFIEHDDDAFFKSADELTTEKLEYQSSKVIFVVRDPRDVIVSSYFHKTKRYNFFPKDGSKKEYVRYQGSIKAFIAEKVGSLETLIEYYNIWERSRDIPEDFLLISYEEMSKSTYQTLLSILIFMGLENISDDIILESIEYASFDNMRKMEKNDIFSSAILKASNNNDIDSYKTRKGVVGGYLEYLDEKDVKYVNEKINTQLSDYYSFYHSFK